MQSGPSWGGRGLEKRGEGRGGGTQTASLNQQHFLNIFNVKANSKNKRKKRERNEGDGSSAEVRSDFGISHFFCSGALLMEGDTEGKYGSKQQQKGARAHKLG